MQRRARRPKWSSTGARSLVAGFLGLMLGVTLLPATAGAESTPGVTSTSITVGATVPLTGPAAPGYDEIAPAMNAVFDYVNAHGGVFGRKIHYKYLDDGYNPSNTATLTRQLVLQDNIFADVGSLGTPTQSAVQGFLNAQKVPQLFIESGCNCWSNPKFPQSFGWQPPYTVDGKILGAYIKANFAGEKVGYLSQDDEFGQDVVKGLDMEIPSSSVVSKQTYDAATLAGPLSNQMAALKAAGAQVVVLATIPAATALSMLPAVAIGYSPQYVVDNVGADCPDCRPAALLLHPERRWYGGSGNGCRRPAERSHHGRLLRPRIGYVQPLGADREETSRAVRALPLCQVRARREHPVRRRTGVHVRTGIGEGGEKPHAPKPEQRHRERRQELRDPWLRASLLLELVALRLRGRGGPQVGELGPAGRDAHRQLDRRSRGEPGRDHESRIGPDQEVHRADISAPEEPGARSPNGGGVSVASGSSPTRRSSRRAPARRHPIFREW